jgi:UDP-N-acetylmuramyl pentapeptide phosphotransferase/UDP-N-acetylglucosamine-1-phosphate transferase
VIVPALAAAFVLSFVLSALLTRYRGRFALLDLPNARSLHAGATPRAGGLAILAGLAAGAVIAGSTLALPGGAWAAAALLLVAAISFADDIWRLPALLRLAVHLAAALMLVLGGAYMLPVLHLVPGWDLQEAPWVLVTFSVLLMVWCTNLYNFMDGMDGLAGGMAVIGFGSLVLLGCLAHAPAYACAASLVAAAAAGFLPFNLAPARLFMGDVGSGSLGFLVGLFLLWAERAGLFPLWLGFMVFSPFLVDATWTVIRRALQGKKPWQAHREHFYQRLVGQGWSHRRTTLCAYALMLKCSLFAVLAICFTASGVRGLLLGWLALTYVALIAYVNVIERKPVTT